MTSDLSSAYRHLGGSLPLEDPTYVVREADSQLYQALLNGDFCYVLNSRQMGKSSLRVRVMQRLQAGGIACGVVDLSAMGTESTESAWYKGLAYRIMRNFRGVKSDIKSAGCRSFDWRGWWNEHDFLSPVQQLGELIREVLLATVEENIVIFIDEIDSVLSLGFSTDDFFAWIRFCYNNRADDEDYRRLTFCLLGVATPSDLMVDKKRTPFNVGRAIALTGFDFTQAQTALQPGLSQATIPNPEAVLREILTWTGGQPFLTQKLCQLVVSHFNSNEKANEKTISQSVEEIVQAHILTNWEGQDEPEHLRTIRDRFYAHLDRTNRLLGLYQQILSQNGIKSNDSPEQRELCLTGLTIKRQNQLIVFNPIYVRIFNADWVGQALANIRPYAPSFDTWIASDRQDATQLLTGLSLASAKAWATGKSLSDQDYTYLAACQEAETAQAAAALAVEAQAKQVLAIANRKAKRQIKVGEGLLSLAGVLLTGSLLFSAQTIQSARGEAADAQTAAADARLTATESQTIANEERENAKLARAAVERANRETQEANEITMRAREAAQQALLEAETALSEANTAEQTALKAEREAETARKNTQTARAATTQAIAQRQQAEQQVAQAKRNLAQANQQVAAAKRAQHELTVGTQLERSALALLRTSTRPNVDTLIEAVRLGETLTPFLADGRSLSRYPAVTPILALQTLLTQISKRGAVSTSAPVTDTTLEETVKVWFSADASRYATLHSYDGFRAVYLQFWSDRGEPIGDSIEVQNGYGGGYVTRPLSFYLKSTGARAADGEKELLAIACQDQTICVKNFNQNFDHASEHDQLERVLGEQAAFNPERKELITLDKNNVLRRWKLFEQGKWIGTQAAEHQILAPENELYLTADGRHLWTYQYPQYPQGQAGQRGQAGRIQVFDLEGNIVKEHPNPEPGYAPTPYLAFSPSGELIGDIELSQLPGQSRQLLSIPLKKADAFDFLQFDFLQNNERIVTVKHNSETQTSIFQIHDLTGRLVFDYAVENKSLKIFPQPQGSDVLTLECDLGRMQNCVGKVWDSEGQQVTTVDALNGGLKWTPKGKYLATWDNEKLRLTDLEHSKTSIYNTGGELISFQSGDELYFWIRYRTGMALWSIAEQEPITTVYPLGMNASVRTAWYDESSQTIFAVSDHVEHGAVLISQPLGRENDLSEPIIKFDQGQDWTFSPEGDGIIVSQFNGDLQRWSTDGTLEASFVGHEGTPDLVRFSPDGSQILTYSKADRTTRLWDLQGRQMAEYVSDHIPSVNTHWSQLITLEQRPSMHPNLPETQIRVWSIDSLETLLADACQRLAPYLRNPAADKNRSVCN